MLVSIAVPVLVLARIPVFVELPLPLQVPPASASPSPALPALHQRASAAHEYSVINLLPSVLFSGVSFGEVLVLEMVPLLV